MTRVRGVLTVVVLFALLLVADRSQGPTGGSSFDAVELSPMPVTDGSGALTSTWYCAAGTAGEDGFANVSVVAANFSDQARAGTIRWIVSGSEEPRPDVVEAIEVGPSAVINMAAEDAVEDAPVVSAVVEFDGGGVVVEHLVTGPRGGSVAPCATDASATWHLANGITERDSRQVLALFNPFPDDAVVDISFATSEGREAPAALQGVPVEASSTTLVEVGESVRRRATTATSIVARSGRLVVDRVQLFDGVLGRSGVSLSLAAPAPAEVWMFPDGLFDEGIDQRWHIYNPNEREALVSLEVVPASGDVPEPVDLTLPGRSQLVVDASELESIEAGVAHSSTVRSLNGVAVVAEREVDAREPAPRQGWSSSLGSVLAAPRWGFALGEATSRTDEWIVAYNPGAGPARFSVVALAGGQIVPIEGLQDLVLAPAERRAIRLGEHIERAPLPIYVDASDDIVVERDIYGVDRLGVSVTIGVPVT